MLLTEEEGAVLVMLSEVVLHSMFSGFRATWRTPWMSIAIDVGGRVGSSED